jgi:FkbH-like protein
VRHIHDLIDQIDRAPSLAAYLQASREIARRCPDLLPVRVTLLASFTLDLIRPYLEVELARHGLAARLDIAPFNTVARELLDPESETARSGPDVIFVAQALEDVAPGLARDTALLPDTEIERQMADAVSQVVRLVSTYRERSASPIVVHAFPLPPLAGAFEAALAPRSPAVIIHELNRRLVDALSSVPGVFVLGTDQVLATVGYGQVYDPKLAHLGRAPLTSIALLELARAQASLTQAILGRTARCLVLDLDGTLWGGVVGELGAAGIQLGGAYPGSAYQDFQRTLLSLVRRGVLLAINSKNNPRDVDDVFDRHPEMLLRREHFAAVRVNWRDKPSNMRDIAAELNLGLESLVFFDDNPAERALMREMLPSVRTLDVPADPTQYSAALARSRVFDRIALLAEDRQRASMYQAQARRRALQASSATLEGFLESLEMVVAIDPLTSSTLPRAVDLINKTNQFNVTTRRHSAAEVAEMAASGRCGIFTLRLSDRFGDQGIVGVAIVRLGEAAQIETFLLSCRVIGRSVETALLRYVADWAHAHGSTSLDGEVVPTPKNTPARDVFARHGFQRLHEDDRGSRWRLDLNSIPFEWPRYIRRAGQMQAPLDAAAVTS